jgi:general L-amino acid transport system substrate-binding protein
MKRSGMSRRRFLGAVGAGAAALGGAAMGMSGMAHAAQPQPGGILERIQNYGKVRVAVHDTNSTGLFVGYDADKNPLPNSMVKGITADFSRALAAAIFGSGNVNSNVEFVGSNSTNRFEKLAAEEVDVIFRTVTARYDRDVYYSIGNAPTQGYTFGPTFYFDGANVLIWNDAGPGPYNVAIGTGTSTIDAVDAVNDSNINIVPVPNSSAAKQAFLDGTYNGTTIHGYANDASGLVGTRLEHTDTYIYFPTPVSKEPLSPTILEGDDNWADIVRWVMFALLSAEEQRVTMTSVNNKWGSKLPSLGLPKNWPSETIRAAGNYGEIWYNNLQAPYYDENLPSPFDPRGQNNLYTNSGLHYPWPGLK